MYTETRIECAIQRLWGTAGLWLVTLRTGLRSVTWDGDQTPQARAVTDDFGNLVIVRGWI